MKFIPFYSEAFDELMDALGCRAEIGEFETGRRILGLPGLDPVSKH